MDNEKKEELDAMGISAVEPTEPVNWWIIEIEKRWRHEEKAGI